MDEFVDVFDPPPPHFFGLNEITLYCEAEFDYDREVDAEKMLRSHV